MTTSRAEFDVGPLSWVKGEIDLAMQRGAEVLRAFAQNTADRAKLKSAQAHLHQAHGALQIVGLDGVTRVSEELESLLADLEREPVHRTPQNFALAERAFEAIVAYLDTLIAGSPNQPLALFPLYGELVAALGGPAADPVDLYFPDFSHQPPRREKIPVVLRAEDEEQYYRDQRGRYQRGLLKWLKGDAGGAEDMRGAVEAIELTQGFAPQRAIWWVALAFFDALVATALPEDVDAKRLCNKIDQQIRRLIEGSQNVAERLMREALYSVARARPATEHLMAVRQLYRLERTLPAAEAPRARPAETPALKPAREALAQAKDAWNKFASGNPPGLIAFVSAASVLRDRACVLGNPDLAALAREIEVLATWLSSNNSKMSDAIALEVATALLLLENALANVGALTAEFTQQSQFQCGRLNACVLGRLLRTAPPIPLLDEMSRRAQERLVMSQVVAEMQANLRSIEQVLDAFFRNPSNRGGLAALSRPLHQVKGALEMLGETRARDALAGCESEIRRFAQAGYAPRQEDFEHIAQTVSGLGFYIEALAAGKADFDEAMHPIPARQPEAELAAAQPVPTVEAQLRQQKREAQSLIQEWKKKPTDTWLKAELQKNLAAMQKDANLVSDAALEAQAQQALKILDATGEVPLEPQVAQALENIVPVTQAPATSTETAMLIDASDEKIDAELLAIYLEEADEVLAGVRDHLEILGALATDKLALTNIRRGFHTLKGSGRMVGLTRLGEAAGAVEKATNTWLQEERAATPDLLSLVSVAHDYFADNVARLKAGGISSDESALVELAGQVMRGEPLGIEAAPAEVPLEAAPGAPAVEARAPEEEEFVTIGEEKVSATLFVAFTGEAQAHLDTMAREREVLAQQAVITDALMRAVHTLAGISGTVKVGAVRDLGYALEQALQKLSAAPLSEAEEGLVGETIDALGAMVADALDRHQPLARPDLIKRLDRSGAPLEEEPAGAAWLPEEEAGLPREPETVPAPPAAAAPIMVPSVEETALPPLEPAEPALPHPAGVVVEEIEAERRQQRLEDDLDPQLLPVFLEEANDLVPAIGRALREWRAHTEDSALGHSLQRMLHTLKGSARMAGAMALGELTHHMETRVENALPVKTLPGAWFDDLETAYDRIGLLFERAQQRGAAGAMAPAPGAPGREAPLQGMTLAAAQEPPPHGVRPAVAQEPPLHGVTPAAAQEPPLHGVRPAVAQEPPLPRAMLRVRADVVDRLVNQAGEVSIARSRIEGEMRTLRAAMQELTDNVVRLRSQLREIEIQAETQMQSRLKEVQVAEQQFDPLEFDRFTRFQELTRLMAESVSDVQTVHQNLIHAVDQTEAGLLAQARLNRDLQQDLMRVRMVPVGSLAERLYRIVRQAAKDLGKRANLDIRGAQVELDRSVLERITAPFEHMLRNAVTHGIETPAARAAKGKPEIGEIHLSIAQEGNDVLIALADDGRGLDMVAVRAKAVATGLLGERVALSDAEVADFIFLPGFTTATVVTEIAGRGIGMDVVRTEVAALGGRIELDFQKEKGTRFTIYLPLTLAVTQAVLVRSGARAYAVPAVMVEQVLQLKAEQIVGAYSARYAEWQARRYPFHYLPHLLGSREARAETKRFSPVLFLRSGSNSIALHVDDILGSNQEIVVKAIGPQLQRVPGITGATVLGSGEIALIVNPVQLALREAAAAAPAAAAPVEVAKAALRPTVMVVDDSLTVRKFTGRLLAREGYEVLVAKDGVDAMERLQEVVPDVMLVDIEMPRMDGFDLTRNVRADPRLAGVPIIIITSRSAEKHQSYAREIGANAFLGKPYQEEELLAQIAGVMKAKRAA